MISLKQFTDSQVVAKDDALLYDWLSQNAVSLFFGCEVTSLGANMMRITSGRGIILGRTFEVQQEDFAAQLATPGSSWKGRVYVEIDTANAAQPISIKTVAAESLAPLVQEDINGDGTIYQFELYTYAWHRSVVHWCPGVPCNRPDYSSGSWRCVWPCCYWCRPDRQAGKK